MNKELTYNYVYFNANFFSRYEYSRNEFNSICLRDAESMEGVQVVPCLMSHMPLTIRKIHYYFLKVNNRMKKIGIDLSIWWYPLYFKPQYRNGKPICFVIAEVLPMKYLMYLKKKYPSCKLVKLHRDLIKLDRYIEYKKENMNNIFDLRMSYDKLEAEKYGIEYFDNIESKIIVDVAENSKCDVFFAGKAKNRFDKIMEAYEAITAAGLKCEFYILQLPEKERIYKDGIIYMDAIMPYIDVLRKSVNAKCILDINQEGAVGYTSRILEAIMYNKKIITDNPSIFDSKFYNPNYIQYVKSMKEIDAEFITNNIEINFNYQGEFSPCNLIYRIDNEILLCNRK